MNKNLNNPNIVLCGSFRKDDKGLRELFAKLRDFHFNVISPQNVDIVSEETGFVFMKGETCFTPELIEKNHLLNIQKADIVWLFAPDGYIGYTALAEISYAISIGKEIFLESCSLPKEIEKFPIHVVSTPSDAIHKSDYSNYNLNYRRSKYDFKNREITRSFWELAINRSMENNDKLKKLAYKLF
ncbi:MAG: hypothetical protein ACMUIU_10480 [bacterium]